MNLENREAVTALKESLDVLLSYQTEELYSRSEWGSKLSLNAYREDFERIFALAKIFQSLPFHLLPDAQLSAIKTDIENAASHLVTIDQFDISTANNAESTLNTYGDTAGTHADTITVKMAQWISYLAYQKGDVNQNIQLLEGAVGDVNTFIEKAKERVSAQESEIKKIVQQAQDFAGDKGVTIFTEQFNKAADKNMDEAAIWLKITTGIFALTIVLIAIFMYQLIGVDTWYEWASRATLVGVMLTGGLWCGKTYRILRHQHTQNLHKANGLKSFMLFRDAADNDEATRNAVLLETTKAIFTSGDSGFITESSSQKDSNIRLIDTSRALANATTIAK